jgi:hypothetical protein
MEYERDSPNDGSTKNTQVCLPAFRKRDSTAECFDAKKEQVITMVRICTLL